MVEDLQSSIYAGSFFFTSKADGAWNPNQEVPFMKTHIQSYMKQKALFLNLGLVG